MVIKVTCDTHIVESKKLYSKNKESFLKQNKYVIAHKDCKTSVISTIKMTHSGTKPSEKVLSDISSYFNKASLFTSQTTLEDNLKSIKIGKIEFISLLVKDESLKNTYTSFDTSFLSNLDVVSLFACYTKKDSENPLKYSKHHEFHDIYINNAEPYPEMLIPKEGNNTVFHVNRNLVQILLTPGYEAQVNSWESSQSTYDPHQETVGEFYFDSNGTLA